MLDPIPELFVAPHAVRSLSLHARVGHISDMPVQFCHPLQGRSLGPCPDLLIRVVAHGKSFVLPKCAVAPPLSLAHFYCGVGPRRKVKLLDGKQSARSDYTPRAGRFGVSQVAPASGVLLELRVEFRKLLL